MSKHGGMNTSPVSKKQAARATAFLDDKVGLAKSRIETCEKFGLAVDPDDVAIVEAAEQ